MEKKKKKKRPKKQTLYIGHWVSRRVGGRQRFLNCSVVTKCEKKVKTSFFFGVADKSWHYTLGIATSMHDRHLVCSRMMD